jgi:Coenzyme PQQ synthesis protein D (PqqD)
LTPLQLRCEDLPWQDLDGEIVVLEPRASVYLTMNAAAALLWRRLAEGTSREELVDALIAAYRLPPAHAERDVDQFLDQLRAQELLHA